ncbi:B-box zinc finger protein 32-like [Chenopodium quinoa]|uniref:B box-type domain-containing protein n=1 Tax=Chenopodium quinoa TaxID=63459 RepID=A0A803KQP8_CHEQI|nr:B-box zinc finger protein 32-like [Chenopodium quinoa]
MVEMVNRNCELCSGEASLYCPSDNAFLCYTCDSKVHCANFLVARHVRSLICPNCRKTDGKRFSGAGVPPPSTLFCRDCSPPKTNSGEVADVADDDNDDDSLSSSSSCISSTGDAAEDAAEMTSSSTSSVRKRAKVDVRRRERNSTVVVDLKVEGILVNWCKRMGVVEERDYGKVVNMAVELLSGCLDGITVWPFRVSLAASFWVAIRVCGSRSSSSAASTCQDLRRLEQISGVPAKLILATEAKIARVIKRRRSRKDHEEGWAEC